MSPAQRADARRNREKLLEAAEAVFGERGADASLDDVARYAQLGIGTLYRHFPSREALLAAACDDRLLALASRSRADERAAPADALAGFLQKLVQHASIYRGLATSLGVILQNGSPGCHAATEEGQRLLAVAQRSGSIRADVDFDDLVCMATAISLAVAADETNARRVHRLVTMFVDGLRVPAKRQPKKRVSKSVKA